jgi:hypothetical protein
MRILRGLWHRLYYIPMFNNSLIAYPKNVDDCATSILRIAPNENMQCDQVSLSDRVPNVKFQVGIPTQAFFQRSHGCFGSVRDSWIVLNERGSHISFKRSSGLFLDKTELAKVEYDPFRLFSHEFSQIRRTCEKFTR